MSSKFRPLCHLNYVHDYWICPSIWCVYSGYYPLNTLKKVQSLQRICLTIRLSLYIIWLTYMARSDPIQQNDPKAAALRDQGALHSHPEAVKDEAFGSHEFFDPRDLVQVRYEMLRRHRVDGRPVTEVADKFGVSRQAFYKTESAFKTQGAAGLLPRRRGPKKAHKCTDEILDFIEQWRSTESAEVRETVVQAVQRQFRVTINPRSIERALARRKKKQRTKQEPKE